MSEDIFYGSRGNTGDPGRRLLAAATEAATALAERCWEQTAKVQAKEIKALKDALADLACIANCVLIPAPNYEVVRDNLAALTSSVDRAWGVLGK